MATYTVKSGDSLSAIGKQFGVDYKTITGYKSGNPSLIYPGEVLTIPGSGNSTGSSTPSSSIPSQTQTPSFQSSGQVTDYLNGFQASLAQPTGKVPGKFDINPATGKAYGFNPATNSMDDNYWGNIVEPQLKQQYGGGGSSVQSYQDIASGLGLNIKPPDEGTKPTAPNLLATYTQLRVDKGLDTLEAGINDLTTQRDALISEGKTRTLDEQGKPVPLNVISGRVSEVQRQTNEKLDTVNRTIDSMTRQYTTGLNTINVIMDLTQKDYANAKDQYDTSFSQALQAITLVRGIRSDQVSEQQHAQDIARADLQVYTNLISSGNLDVKSLAPAQQLQLNRLEVAAGFPVGFMASIKKDPKSDIIFTTSDNGVTQIGFRNADGSISVQSYGTSTKSATAAETLSSAYQTIAPQIQSKAGNDGKVSAYDWNTAKEKWIQAGYSASDFDSQFSGYIDTRDLKSYKTNAQPTINQIVVGQT